MGWLRALGLGALPLWPLDVLRQRLGLVAWTAVRRRVLPSILVAGVCIVLGLGRWLGFRIWLRWMGRLRLAPDRTLRLFPSLVGRISRALRHGWIPWRVQSLRGLPSVTWRNSLLEREQYPQRAYFPRHVDDQRGALRRGRQDEANADDSPATGRSAHDGGQYARGSITGEPLGQRTSGGAVDDPQWRVGTFLWSGA